MRDAVDRNAQNIPLPLGGMAPVRLRRRTRRRWVRRHLDGLAAAVGAGCVVAGVVLLATPAPVAVTLEAGRVHVGSMVLRTVPSSPETTATLYTGGASYALVEHPDGSASAAAAWALASGVSLGSCDLRQDGPRLVESCTFTRPGRMDTSVDVLDPRVAAAWQRTYADGLRVTIPIDPDGAAVPVPFPVGR